MESISLSDQVLIFTTLFLGAVAILTPWIGEGIKSLWARPKINITFAPSPPACHRTRLLTAFTPGQTHDTFYFRFEVTNKGRSQARRCEAVFERLWIADAAGAMQEYPRLTPVTLQWGSGYDEFVDINPGRRFYCDFLSVPDREAQQAFGAMGGYVDPPEMPSYPLGVVICVKAAFFSQPNRLPPGKYRIQVAIYSENADTVRAVFDLAWSGAWKRDERDIHQECVISISKVAA